MDYSRKTKKELIGEITKINKKLTKLEKETTRNNQADEEIREAKERKWEFADLLPNAVFEIDKEGKVLFANLPGLRVFGRTKQDLKEGFTCFDVVAPKEHKKLRTNMARILKKEPRAPMGYTGIKKDGTTIPVVIQATHIKKGNKVIGVRGVIVDITQVEHAKKLIEKAKNDLEETIKERSFELKLTNAKLQRIIQETISALSFAIEKRDPYTAGHQQRVAQLTSAIAEKLGFSLSRIKGLHMAALIHDIGKIYVPAEILSKPAQLNKIEFDIIRLHSKVGYDILHTIEFPWPIAQAVLQHHERLDGSGYPFRLTDDEISMEAKIIAVADVVEAMASHRPYRPALGMDKALKEISKNKGILYDPTIVTVCEKLITKETFKFK